ncbi:MAG: methyltransferase type 11 [Proteobacteria bacterium]|nr:MAG: methyltransferase type 11 [Pseudomonadota bacterium]
MEKEQYWSKFAEDFEERNNYVVGSSDMSIIFQKIEQLQNLKNTLELGCGNGTYSKILIKNATNLIATDFSDEMVVVAKNRLKTYENIKVEKANCFKLPYSDHSFDTIFMANLLHIIPEPENAIAECKRVLKENGQLIVISFTSEGMTTLNKILMIYRYLKTYGKPSPFAQSLTVNGTREMLHKHGFEIEESSLLGNKMKAIFVKSNSQ